MQMNHPMFNGTLLFRFFAGSTGYKNLAWVEKGIPTFKGGVVNIEGEPCRIVSFYATGTYGNTEITISTKTGLVRSIRYDSEPLMKATSDFIKSFGNKGDATKGALNQPLSTEEYFESTKVDAVLPHKVFDRNTPP